MTEQRPELRTPGSTVAAAERIVAWLKTALQGNTPDRADVVERHIGQFNSPDEVKRYLSGRTGCIRVAALRADNIYSASLDGLGVTMWAVTWEQEFQLDEEIDLAALPDFLRLGTTLRSGEHTEINDVIHVRGDDGTETD